MDERLEDPVNENNTITTGENQGSQRHKAPKRRSKVTVVRVALVLTAALIVVYVIDLIMFFSSVYCNTQTNEETEVMKETTPFSETTGTTEGQLTTTTSSTTTNSITSCTNIMVPCAEDWQLHGEKCYYFSPNTVKLSWTNSSERCQQLSGNLVKIESEEEQTFLYNKLRGLMTKDEGKFWIGLTDSETEGVWKWTDGSHLNTSSAFWFKDTPTSQNIKEPDNWTGEDPKGEDCVRMGERGDGFELKCWLDQSCIKENRFICEKQASISPNCK